VTNSANENGKPRVAVLRAPGRQTALVRALFSAGATPVLCPLIDHELPDPGPALEDALGAVEALASGACAGVAFTSVTTVTAMAALAARAGTTLQVAPGTRVAAVGHSTAAALRAHRIQVDLVPSQHSAAGLVEAWPVCDDTGAATVLLPASALAASTLADGLLEKGWRPRPVTVYTTVTAPADPDRALDSRPPQAIDGTEALTPTELAADLVTGRLDSAILTSPSTTRRVVHLLDGRACATGFVAIGPRTAAEASVLGLTVDAIATDTSVEAIAAALEARTEVRGGGT
jgi:uroporphyrinogen-III synthase